MANALYLSLSHKQTLTFALFSLLTLFLEFLLKFAKTQAEVFTDSKIINILNRFLLFENKIFCLL